MGRKRYQHMVKVNYNLPKAYAEYIKKVAEENGTDRTSVIRQALAVYSHIRRLQNTGSIFYRGEDGEECKYVFVDQLVP